MTYWQIAHPLILMGVGLPFFFVPLTALARGSVDIGHVLAEHDTTPLDEIQQGSFQGGNRREDGFFFVQFVMLQFHHGIKITPVAPPQVGNFDPEEVLWAIHRGAKCNVDITHQWNYWPLMSLPLQQAHPKVALLPKLSVVREA